MSEPLRTCRGCGVCANNLEDLSDFIRNKSQLHGYDNHCKTCRNAQIRVWKATKGKGYQQCARLRAVYGLTLEQYDTMLSTQGGSCSICKTVTPDHGSGRFVVDHCHTTGAVRGLLCNSCNVLLGGAKDNQSVLLEAVQYLIRTNKETTNV